MVKTKKYLGIFSFLISEIIGLLITTGYFFADDYNRSLFWENFIKGLRCYQEVIPIGLFVGIFLVYPFVLTLLNLYFLFAPMKDELHNRKGRQTEYITVIWGTFCSAAFHLFLEIQYNADWTETLVNEQVHTPIYTQAQSTVYLLVILGIVGYLVLSAFKVTKLPPLVTVLCIAAMYLGIVECIFWIVQVFGWGEDSSMLCLLPFNCIVIAAKTIRRLITEWKQAQEKACKVFKNPAFNKINEKLMNAASWPLAAFILMWPLLGILIGLLVLMGQQPDALITAWTETSDWNLSQRVAPQNVYQDMHYLCTVAAGGHDKVVKPVRLGERHGHPVVVNRQLCVANAFEQILEEKHRGFIDMYVIFMTPMDFPLQKKIRSPYTADFVYFVMKPLEWVFLLVLYLTDANPENRIALQYMPPAEKAKLQKAMAEKNTTAQGRHAKEGKVTVMKQENIAKWLKAIVIGTALFGVGIYGYVIPTWGRVIVYNNPEFSDRFFPWLIFLWITAIPCYIALIFAWKIFTQIGKNNSFSYVNAKYFKHITRLALSDTVYFLLGNFVLLMWNKSHPGVFLASFLVAFVGVAIAVLCIALSHLVYKAAQMNEENELTI